MQKAKFSIELAQAFFSSEEAFPVDLDDAWGWLGYAEKRNAVRKLTGNFQQDVDYAFASEGESSPTLGLSPHKYHLSVECFKRLAMMAETDAGDQVRKYFLECERVCKKAAAEIPTLKAEIARLIGLMEAAPKTVTRQVVERPEPAAYMQGVRVEVNRVWADVGPHDAPKARVLIAELLDAAERYLHGLGEPAVTSAGNITIKPPLIKLLTASKGRPMYVLNPLPEAQRVTATPTMQYKRLLFTNRERRDIHTAAVAALRMNGFPSGLDLCSLVNAVFHPSVVAEAALTNFRLSLSLNTALAASGYADKAAFSYRAEDRHLGDAESSTAYFRSEAPTNA